jgi:D-alanyl-D-alanine carboxypeptidase/D-alanyl-D-alanine-endopeptidase (penicillin-binding protein 4)
MTHITKLASCLFLLALPKVLLAEPIPKAIESAITRSSISSDAISWSISHIQASTNKGGYTSQEISAHNADQAMNPASTMKLITSLASMEILGPQYRWKTEIFTNGQIQGDTLKGDLLFKGSGDPKLIPEEINKMMLNLKAMGINKLSGDIFLDRSAYDQSVKETSFSDGETSRSYNVAPDALLFAFNSFSFQFYPSADNSLVLIKQTPRLANLKIENNLKVINGGCTDWKKDVDIQIDIQKDGIWLARFNGNYPNGCKVANWNVVANDSNTFFAQSVIAAWEDVGGIWLKMPNIKTGLMNNSYKPIMTHFGVPLYESVKDINKLSNNVMARQLLLTLALEKTNKPSNTSNGGKLVKEWLKKNNLEMPELIIENGSGLSRIERVSAKHLNEVLLLGLNSPVHDYYIDSLPIAGVDGTMKHRLLDKLRKFIPDKKEQNKLKSNTATFPSALQKYGAYIKTGSLADARSISGYVVSRTGELYVVTSFINDANASAGRSIHDAILIWLLDDGPKHH